MKLKINWSGRSHNFTSSEKKYLMNVLDSDNLTQGVQKNKFEKSLRRYFNRKNIFCTSSAASALEIIATLLNIKKGDEIIIPAHTYCASAIPFVRNGAKIIWADIDFQTRTLSFEDVKKKVTNRTKAIVVVHLYGYAVDVTKFKNISKKIKIIEDCAQAMGAEINKIKAGVSGDFGCFSFHSQKNITTLGEGGAIYIKSDNLAKKVPGLRHNGHCDFSFKRKRYWYPAMGNLDLDITNQMPYKYTLSEIQCAAGHLLMKRLDQLNLRRIQRAKKFIEIFHGERLVFNPQFKHKRHVYHLLSAYVIKSRNFNNHILISNLYKKYGIKCAVQYYPLYRYDLFKKIGLSKNNCPVTDNFYDNMISFPFHIWMSENDFDYMISSTRKVLNDLKI